MKSVRIFYAGIPAKNTNEEKRNVLKYFHMGIGPDAESAEVEAAVYQPCDLAVIQGWVHENSQRTPHLVFRKKIIDNQRQINKHTLAIDSNLFLYADPGNTKTYLRFSLDDVFPTTGNYFTDTVDPSRWQQIKNDIGIELKPWKNGGDYVLVCLQRNGGWSMKGLDVMEWLTSTIQHITAYTNLPIVVRAHPGDKRAKDYLKVRHPRVSISTNIDIREDFKNAYAVITYNSSPGVAAAIEGVPVFVTDPNPKNSQAYDVSNYELYDLRNPKKPDRQAWIEKLSMSHFSFEDLKNGTAWNIIRNYI